MHWKRHQFESFEFYYYNELIILKKVKQQLYSVSEALIYWLEQSVVVSVLDQVMDHGSKIKTEYAPIRWVNIDYES